MKVERAVVDSNVLISAALSLNSAPARIVDWLLENARLVFCEETFAELETRLWRPKFDRYLSLEDRRLILHDLSAVGEWLTLPQPPLPSISRDADNDKFVHLALCAKAEWLISGDRDLLDLPPVDDLLILSPVDALTLIET